MALWVTFMAGAVPTVIGKGFRAHRARQGDDAVLHPGSPDDPRLARVDDAPPPGLSVLLTPVGESPPRLTPSVRGFRTSERGAWNLRLGDSGWGPAAARCRQSHGATNAESVTQELLAETCMSRMLVPPPLPYLSLPFLAGSKPSGGFVCCRRQADIYSRIWLPRVESPWNSIDVLSVY